MVATITIINQAVKPQPTLQWQVKASKVIIIIQISHEGDDVHQQPNLPGPQYLFIRMVLLHETGLEYPEPATTIIATTLATWYLLYSWAFLRELVASPMDYTTIELLEGYSRVV